MQNVTHAVMAQRHEHKDSRDNFPTPPWATRGLLEHIILPEHDSISRQSCLEPACGEGHMAKVLDEYFAEISCSDIYPYGYGDTANFLEKEYVPNSFDWVITNPPFKHAEEFIQKSLEICRVGVAILARTVFIESIGRYERIFKHTPPSKFAQFSERVPMVKGRLDRKASTATGYSWIIWEKSVSEAPRLMWIPPCRKVLEREHDYETPGKNHSKEISENSRDQLEIFAA